MVRNYIKIAHVSTKKLSVVLVFVDFLVVIPIRKGLLFLAITMLVWYTR